MRAYRLAVVLTAVAMLSMLVSSRAFAQGVRADSGAIAVKTVPADAQVYIDGERWVGPETDGRLVVQVAAGRHVVDVRAPGYRSFVIEVDVRSGETTPVNVSLVGAAAPARQPASGAQPAAGGIRQVANETEESGFAVSPGYRFADLNHHNASLLGGYGGVVLGGHLFVGAGGYGQLDYHRNDVSLAYGGGVFEWREWNDRPVGITLHALVGGGDARLSSAYFVQNNPRPSPFDSRSSFGSFYYIDVHTGFFVFEPELQVNFRVAHDVRIAAGAGYRVTSADHGVSSDALNGWSGTFSVRFGK